MAAKKAGIKDIMSKLKTGLQRKLMNSSINLVEKVQKVEHDHGEQENQVDSASDLDIGRELDILKEIREYKEMKKKIKLR